MKVTIKKTEDGLNVSIETKEGTIVVKASADQTSIDLPDGSGVDVGDWMRAEKMDPVMVDGVYSYEVTPPVAIRHRCVLRPH